MDIKSNKYKRVFLINLSTQNFKKENILYLPQPHLGILCLKEVAKDYDINIEVLDGDFNNLNDETIFKRILKAKPGIIGFSPFQNTMDRIISLIQRINNKLPETIIILGGVHASIMAADIIRDIPEVDYIIKGEATVSLPTLLLSLLKIKQTDFTEIEGLTYRLNEDIIENNASIFPDLDLLPNLGIPQIPLTNEISLVSSKGCVSNCSFCCTPYYMKLSGNSKYRHQSPEKVINDITQIIESSENKEISIYFPDSDFIGLNDKTIERASKIADYILSKNINIEIKIACQAKAIVKAGIEFWKKWRKAGLTMIYCGFEAGSDEDLVYYNKSSRVNDGLEAYRILSECNICLFIGFIMFNTYSNKEKLLNNLKFLNAINELHIFGNISREIVPYPGTKIFKDLTKEKLLSFEKPYLETHIKYISKSVESVKNTLCSHSREQMLIDYYCYKFDFAVGSGKKTIPFAKCFYKVDEVLSQTYLNYKKERASIIESYAIKIVDSSGENLTDIGNEMNTILLKRHREFISNIKDKVFFKTKKTNPSYSILSFCNVLAPE
jgi:anaerobic magnesium-protoporphyrin IX monomethyl ester cyclase